MIRVSCKHCGETATFENRDVAIDRGWRYLKAGTEQVQISEAWFCPTAPTADLSAFLESKLGGTTEGRIRE
jgi:hypothetical protein